MPGEDRALSFKGEDCGRAVLTERGAELTDGKISRPGKLRCQTQEELLQIPVRNYLAN